MNINEKINLLSMVGTWASALASIITAFITGVAALIAYRTLHSWKDKEKFIQLVKLKRAIFSYRQKVEIITSLQHDNQRIAEHVENVLEPALFDIFHEMKLAGMKERESSEFKLFNALFEAQQEYKESQLNYRKLLDSALDLQKKVDV